VSTNTQDNNISISLTLTLEEAATGKIESLRIPRREVCESCAGTGSSWRSEDGTCSSCGNKGWFESEKVLDVRIPAGIETGSILRVAEEGEVDPVTETRGDLNLTINVSEHEMLERRGKHLYITMSVPREQIATGTEVIVPTLLDGRKQLRIPPGTSTDTVFRLAGLGVRSIESIERGDLFVKLEPTGRETTARASAAAASASTSKAPADKRTPPSSLNRVKTAIGSIIALAIVSMIGFIYVGYRRSPVENQNVNAQPSPAKITQQTSIVSPTPVPVQTTMRTRLSLPNGSDITPPQGPRGNNRLTIVNGGNYDVAMKIVSSSTQKTRRFVYIRANSTAVIKNVPPEVCVLRIMSGTDWDVDAGKFLYGLSFYEFDKPFDLRRIRWTVSLQPALGGTLRDIPINEEAFKDK
jgi:hypothetical protein